MVKGSLAWFLRVFKSSGPSPSTPSTSSTIVESNHNKQHNKAENKSALKIWIWTFFGIPLVIQEMTKVVSLGFDQWTSLNISI